MLNAGNYGVPQSRKRTFIWAAAPEEQLPQWPQQKFVFRSPQLTINLPGGVAYTAVPQREVGRGPERLYLSFWRGTCPRRDKQLPAQTRQGRTPCCSPLAASPMPALSFPTRVRPCAPSLCATPSATSPSSRTATTCEPCGAALHAAWACR